MRQELLLHFGPGEDLAFVLPDDEALAPDLARRWLDDEFVANDCEPLRASGKVLTADKLLVLAATLGAARFGSDAAYARAFARAALGALGKPLVRVDVEAGTVGY